MVVVPFVPLAFLDDGSSPPPSPSSPPQKSFAKVLSNACDIPLRQLLVPCLKGDALSVKIPEDEYKARLEGCKNNLHGRLSLSKGDTLLNYQYLHIKLEKVCKPMGKWRMVPLGKGYFDFSFACLEDICRVLAMGSWPLNLGSLKLFCHGCFTLCAFNLS